MAIDQVPEQEDLDMDPESSGLRATFLVIFLVLAGLVVGEIYSIHKTNSMRDALEAHRKRECTANGCVAK
jgi:hypothetical protein